MSQNAAQRRIFQCNNYNRAKHGRGGVFSAPVTDVAAPRRGSLAQRGDGRWQASMMINYHRYTVYGYTAWEAVTNLRNRVVREGQPLSLEDAVAMVSTYQRRHPGAQPIGERPDEDYDG